MNILELIMQDKVSDKPEGVNLCDSLMTPPTQQCVDLAITQLLSLSLDVIDVFDVLANYGFESVKLFNTDLMTRCGQLSEFLDDELITVRDVKLNSKIECKRIMSDRFKCTDIHYTNGDRETHYDNGEVYVSGPGSSQRLKELIK